MFLFVYVAEFGIVGADGSKILKKAGNGMRRDQQRVNSILRYHVPDDNNPWKSCPVLEKEGRKSGALFLMLVSRLVGSTRGRATGSETARGPFIWSWGVHTGRPSTNSFIPF